MIPSKDWLPLYKLAKETLKISPWDFLLETNLIGVQDPVSGEIGFMSIMGVRGEHLALSRYEGRKGLGHFYQLLHESSLEDSYRLLMIPQMMLSFEDKSFLLPEDKTLIQSLGLKFKGPKGWPQFRTYRPSFFPWFMEEYEMQVFQVSLEQTLLFIQELMAGENRNFDLPQDHYWVRVPYTERGITIWKSEIKKLLPEMEVIRITATIDNFSELHQLPKGGRWEMETTILTEAARDDQERPYFPHLLIGVDTGKGVVTEFNLCKPLPTVEAMWSSMVEGVAKSFIKNRMVPKEIVVRSEMMKAIVHPLAEELKISIVPQDKLKTLDPIMKSLMESMSRDRQ